MIEGVFHDLVRMGRRFGVSVEAVYVVRRIDHRIDEIEVRQDVFQMLADAHIAWVAGDLAKYIRGYRDAERGERVVEV